MQEVFSLMSMLVDLALLVMRTPIDTVSCPRKLQAVSGLHILQSQLWE